MRSWIQKIAVATLAAGLLPAGPQPGRAKLAPGELQQTAEEAFVYGLPLVMNYAVFYEYFVARGAPGYKAPINQIYNLPRVFTPKDTTIITPDSDTPYSFIGMDLRAEPRT